MRFFLFAITAILVLPQAAYAQSPDAINYTGINSPTDVQYENDSIAWFFTWLTGGACRKNMRTGEAVWYNGTNAPAAIACGGDMLIAANGVKWFAAAGTLIRYNDTTWQEIALPAGYKITKGGIDKILHTSPDGKIWMLCDTIGINQKVLSYDGISFENYSIESKGLYGRSIYFLGVDDLSRPWVQVTDGNFLVLERLETPTHPRWICTPTIGVNQALVDSNGIWLCGTHKVV